MHSLPLCPECKSEYTYEDGNMYVCPECAHEWSKDAIVENTDDELAIKDGDTVAVIKDLKVKGSSSVVKVGTKVKTFGWSMATMISTVKLRGLAR